MAASARRLRSRHCQCKESQLEGGTLPTQRATDVKSPAQSLIVNFTLHETRNHMYDLSQFNNPTYKGVLYPNDIMENIACFSWQFEARVHDLGLLLELALPRVSLKTCYRWTGYSKERECHMKWLLEVEAELEKMALETPSQESRMAGKAYDKAELKRVAEKRRIFLEQATSVFSYLEEQVLRICAEAGFAARGCDDSEPVSLAAEVFQRMEDTVKYFRKALKHNRTLTSK